MNHVGLTAWSDVSRPRMSSIKNPAETVPMADSGLIPNIRDKDPDAWAEKGNSAFLHWRTPTNQGCYDSDPQRPVGRHGRASTGNTRC